MRRNLYAYQPVHRAFDDVVRLLAAPTSLAIQPATDAATERTVVLPDAGRSLVAEPGELEHEGAGTRWIPIHWVATARNEPGPVISAELAVARPAAEGEPAHLFLAGACSVRGEDGRDDPTSHAAAQTFLSAFLERLVHVMEGLAAGTEPVRQVVIELDEESFCTEWALEDAPF